MESTLRDITLKVKTAKLDRGEFNASVITDGEDMLDVEALRHEGKLIGFNCDGLSMQIVFTDSDGSLREREVEKIELLKNEDGRIIDRIYLKNGRENINTRNAKRFALSGSGSIMFGNNSSASPVRVFDISNKGLGLKCDDERYLNSVGKAVSVQFNTIVGGYPMSARCEGCVARISSLANGSFIIGVRLEKDNKDITAIVMAVQRDELSRLTHARNT